MENKKISVILYIIGLISILLFFVLPIAVSGPWLIYSYGLIIQVTPYPTIVPYFFPIFFLLPFSLAIFIVSLISIVFSITKVVKKKGSENYYEFMRKMPFIIGSLAGGFVLLTFFMGHTILQITLILFNSIEFSIDSWVLTWMGLISLAAYLIIGSYFALKPRIKTRFKTIWVICGYLVPIPLLVIMHYAGFTLALFFPFIGVTIIFLDHLIANRIHSKPELKKVNNFLQERALQRSKIIIYLLIGLVIILGIVIGFLIMRLVWYNTVCPYVGEIFY